MLANSCFVKLVGSQVKLVIAIVFLYASDNFNMIYNNYAFIYYLLKSLFLVFHSVIDFCVEILDIFRYICLGIWYL